VSKQPELLNWVRSSLERRSFGCLFAGIPGLSLREQLCIQGGKGGAGERLAADASLFGIDPIGLAGNLGDKISGKPPLGKGSCHDHP